ncbi:MAG: restriction endonuclease subunit S, partial [Opitutales bacterium]|nr:restriction endonuclease subunit S [Opitutales bacterium]
THDISHHVGTIKTTIGACCDVLSGFPFNSSQFSDDGIRLLRGMNVKRGYLDFSEENNKYWNSSSGIEKYFLEAGDIIIAMDGSLVGKSFGVVRDEDLPLLLVQRVARIRSRKVNMRYLYHCLAKDLFDYTDKKKTAGAVPHISLKDIQSFPLILPPEKEQERLAYVLDNFDAICLDLKIGLPAEIEKRQKQYEFYRDALLNYAASGKLTMSAGTERNGTEHIITR